MGREIRRVPLDFEWPLDKVWEGFLLPDSLHGRRCEPCNGSGQTHFGWWLQGFSYMLGMLADDVREQERGKPLHPWLREFPRAHGHFTDLSQFVIDRPGRDALDFFAALLDTEPEKIAGFMGPGRDTHYVVMQKLLEITGTNVGCQVCEGEGSTETYPGQRVEAEAWEPVDPPKGEGWQLWETVSEGSPISPVFPADDGLIDWLCTDYSGGMDKQPMTREQASAFVRGPGWAPSAIFTSGRGFQSGMAAVADTAIEKQETR